MDIIVELRQRQIARLVKPRTELTFGEVNQALEDLNVALTMLGAPVLPLPHPAGRGRFRRAKSSQ